MGQTSAHAPHETHELSSIVGPSGCTHVRCPRFATFHTDSPWISSHTRTQRMHAMHWFMSTCR